LQLIPLLTMDISIIIVNWNSSGYTTACISSIRTTLLDRQYEIVVVDNASSDNSVAVLKQVLGIQLIISPTNLGFAEANNLGFHKASGDVLLFLNPDTNVQQSAISRMYSALLSSPSLGIIGCKLLNSDLSLQTSCVQAFPTILNQLTDVEALKVRFPRVRMWGISVLFQEQIRPVPVEVVSGACLMIRSDTFEKVDLFSPDYFMYCEDVDLCHKVAQIGLQVGYVADAMVIHYGGQSSKQAKESSFGDVMIREAIYRFLTKTRGALYASLFSYSIFLAAIVRLLLLTFSPHFLLAKKQADVFAARRKWKSILRWSLGRERWTKQLGVSDETTLLRPTTLKN
jgi:GT2 family glycosyltransferase